MPAMACLTLVLATSSFGQTETAVQRAPSNPTRPFVVMPAQSLSDFERKLRPENKAEDLIGGEGMQTRVAIQHDKNRPTAAAELHDASDDVYYVLESTATLTLGGLNWRERWAAHLSRFGKIVNTGAKQTPCFIFVTDSRKTLSVVCSLAGSNEVSIVCPQL